MKMKIMTNYKTRAQSNKRRTQPRILKSQPFTEQECKVTKEKCDYKDQDHTQLQLTTKQECDQEDDHHNQEEEEPRGSIQAKVLGTEEGAKKTWLLCPQFSTTDSHSKYQGSWNIDIPMATNLLAHFQIKLDPHKSM